MIHPQSLRGRRSGCYAPSSGDSIWWTIRRGLRLHFLGIIRLVLTWLPAVVRNPSLHRGSGAVHTSGRWAHNPPAVIQYFCWGRLHHGASERKAKAPATLMRPPGERETFLWWPSHRNYLLVAAASSFLSEVLPCVHSLGWV